MKTKILISLIALLSPVSFAAETIETCEQLLDIPNRSKESYVLSHDIDCNGFVQTKAVDFKGKLDGNGYSIVGLKIRYDDQYVGLFSRVIGGQISHLNLDSMSITENDGNTAIGLLAGNAAYNTSISDVSISKSAISTSHRVSYGLGLLVGYVSNQSQLEGVTSYNSHITTSDKAKHIGGLVGVLENSSLNGAKLDSVYIQIRDYFGGNVYIGGAIGTLEESLLSAVTIENSTIDADLIERGNGSTFIGKMIESRLVNAESVNNSVAFRQPGAQWKSAVAAGFIYKPFSDIPTLENIRLSSINTLPWYNADEYVLTEALQIIK
ncbi:hypothetical protein [Moritella sp. F3]|uniref:hypothetical protein n=1 Tax=Moritella sp. F3 TaxID=2718882 RepID=UPI0018E119CD|nr:hypothetical protein [Moritella sp. F3]GIC77116.1 hypothetical protein FMO001_18430 [Moritella sp. F1]GIC82235.1 hypothetical protein FMO003_25160 [Moritella sp. F3]